MKSFASLFKGCGIPKGGALWSRPQARNTPGRAARHRKPTEISAAQVRQETSIPARPNPRLCREAGKQPCD